MLKTNYLIIVLFFFTGLCVKAQKTEDREIESFDKIEVFGNIEVEMKKGEKETLKIETQNIDPSEVVTKIEDKLLKVKMSSNLFEEDIKVKIYITYTEIREITSNGSAEIKFTDKVTTDKIFISATSGGRVIIDVKLNAVEIKSYQGSHVDIKGEVKIMECFVNTGGVLSGTKLSCNEAFIRMNTGGQGEIIVNKKIEANINTGARFSFFGKPNEKELKTSLGGKVTQWDED